MPTTGFIVNYTPDFAVRFDLNGIPVEVLDHAYRPGEVALTIGGKTIPPESGSAENVNPGSDSAILYNEICKTVAIPLPRKANALRKALGFSD